MPGRLTADKAFGESMNYPSYKAVVGPGQIEGEEITTQAAITFLRDFFPGEDVNAQNYNRFVDRFIGELEIR